MTFVSTNEGEKTICYHVTPRSHTADEYICISEIHGAIGDYITMLDGLKLLP